MRRKRLEELSLREVRFLLVEKRRAWRHYRLEHFHRTGRVLPIANEAKPFENLGRNSTFQRTTKTKPRSVLDHFLLVMEIFAIASLLALMANGLLTLKELNQQVASAMQLPTLVPTPMIREVVLPDGHTPPDSFGDTRPNEAEIPMHLRLL